MTKTLVISAALFVLCNTANAANPEPYSCVMFREAERKCAANTIGPCYVQSEMERLRKQCIREGGRP